MSRCCAGGSGFSGGGYCSEATSFALGLLDYVTLGIDQVRQPRQTRRIVTLMEGNHVYVVCAVSMVTL